MDTCARAAGYFSDAGHPNDDGSTLMYHAIVPSLLEAIAAGKPALVPRKSDVVSASTTKFASLSFTAQQSSIFAWAVSLSLRMLNDSQPSGPCLAFMQPASKGVVDMLNGSVRYETIRTPPIDDGLWHTLVVSHNWAIQKTSVYLDGALLGQVDEQVQLTQAVLSAPPSDVAYRDWIIYRSSLSPAEVSHLLSSPHILQASLEVYAPLDERNLAENHAQSMSVLQVSQATPGAAPLDVSKNDYYVGLFIVLFSAACLLVAFLASRGRAPPGHKIRPLSL